MPCYLHSTKAPRGTATSLFLLLLCRQSHRAADRSGAPVWLGLIPWELGDVFWKTKPGVWQQEKESPPVLHWEQQCKRG